MNKKFVCLLFFVLFLSIAAATQAGVILKDNFDGTKYALPWDCKAKGVPPGWDGYVVYGSLSNNVYRWEVNETNQAMFIRSRNQAWDANGVGFLMYKNVTGDFTATVRITDFTGPGWGGNYVNYNMVGLMARNTVVGNGGPGEDWISNDYFPPWNINGNEVRWCNNAVRYDIEDEENHSGNSLGWNAGHWLKLRRIRNTFSAHWSYDGSNWTQINIAAPAWWTRNDMAEPNVLQVGVYQAMFSGTYARAEFDNFLLIGRLSGQAWYPVPDEDEAGVDTDPVLKWERWSTPTSQKLYLSDTRSLVESNSVSVEHALTGDVNSYDPPAALKVNTKYYWRVNETGSGGIAGDIWNFTTERGIASNPNPANDEVGVPDTTATVQWTPYKHAVSQTIYISSDFNDVNDGVGGVALGAAINSHAVSLQKNTMYYWRVDTDNGTLGFSRGDIWYFTTVFELNVCEDFESEWDYYDNYNMSGTIWDGLIGEGFLSVLDHNNGQLYMKVSNACNWGEADNGVFLYKEIVGPFLATVEVREYPGLHLEDPDLNGTGEIGGWCGIMARISDADLGGSGEDWISISYAPTYGQGSFGNKGDLNGWYTNTARQYFGRNGLRYDCGRFLMMNHAGNGKFYLRWSTDGTTWNILNVLDAPTVAGHVITVNPTIMDNWVGIPLQVGIAVATYGNAPGDNGGFAFDNFCFGRIPTPKAYGPIPSSGSGMNPMNQVISWSSGDFAWYQELYFGTTYDDVNDATHSDAEYKGTSNPSGPNYNANIQGIAGTEDPDIQYKKYTYPLGDIESLNVGQTYYWRVDEVNTHIPQTWTGTIWNFTLLTYATVDNFELYISTGGAWGENPPSTGTLRRTWIDGQATIPYVEYPTALGSGTSGSFVQINTDPCDGTPALTFSDANNVANAGGKSMKFYYDNDSTITWLTDLKYYENYPVGYYTYTAPKFSEAFASIDNAARPDPDTQSSLGLKREWGGYKMLKLSYYGNWNNAAVPMYVGLRSSNGQEATITHSNSSVAQLVGWHDWYVLLSSFKAQNANLDLNDITRIYIGFGDRVAKPTGGRGAVFFDDIELLTEPVCIAGTVTGDFTGNCTVNAADLQRIKEIWLGSAPTGANPLIQLNASGLSAGTLTSWSNTGTEAGKFDVNTADTYCRPVVVANIEGKKAVWFDQNDYLVWRDASNNIKSAPSSITGNNSYTVIYEVWNPTITDQEWVITWSKRFDNVTSVPGSHASFGYGTNGSYGAAAHWEYPSELNYDINFARGTPAAHTWHTIGVSYTKGDPNGSEIVVVDGQLSTSENHPKVDIRAGDPVVVGTYNLSATEPNDITKIVPTYAYSYRGAISKIEVYNYAMTAGQLAIKMGTPIDMKQDNVIDFKDIALFGKNWMVGPVLLGQ